MRVLRHAAGVAVVLMAATPIPAPAQSNDPAQGSPSGKVYEIPLDNARRDAAPSRDRASGTGTTTSPIRSENNFGSSSTVPGTAVETAGSASGSGRSKSDRDGAGAGATGGGSAGGGSNGPTASAPEGDAAGHVLSAPGAGAVTPSESRAYLLLLLALGAAVGLGVAGRYLARGR